HGRDRRCRYVNAIAIAGARRYDHVVLAMLFTLTTWSGGDPDRRQSALVEALSLPDGHLDLLLIALTGPPERTYLTVPSGGLPARLALLARQRKHDHVLLEPTGTAVEMPVPLAVEDFYRWCADLLERERRQRMADRRDAGAVWDERRDELLRRLA